MTTYLQAMRFSVFVLAANAGCRGESVGTGAPDDATVSADDGAEKGDGSAAADAADAADASTDTSAADTSVADARAPEDTSATDTSATDTSVTDTSVAETSASDTGAPDTSAPADTSAPDTTSSDGSVLVDSGPCGVHPGPFMVQLATSKGTFCIDTREVTNAQYTEFTSSADKPLFPGYCSFKSGYNLASATAPRDFPVVSIDWCDAYQYCAWAGKRLCGGMAGGHVVRMGNQISDYVADSQWTAACQNNGPTLFSTGDTFPGGDAGACNITNNGGNLWSADAGATCRGLVAPFDQITNLTGNAGEWEDNCNHYDETSDAGPLSAVICLVRGGTPSSCCVNESTYKCLNADIITTRGTRSAKVGFRCCSK